MVYFPKVSSLKPAWNLPVWVEFQLYVYLHCLLHVCIHIPVIQESALVWSCPRVDKDRSNAISADELQQALSNGQLKLYLINQLLHVVIHNIYILPPFFLSGSWTAFNPETIRLMIGKLYLLCICIYHTHRHTNTPVTPAFSCRNVWSRQIWNHQFPRVWLSVEVRTRLADHIQKLWSRWFGSHWQERATDSTDQLW